MIEIDTFVTSSVIGYGNFSLARSGVACKLIFKLDKEGLAELISVPAVVIIQMDSGIPGFYFLW